MKKQLFNIAVLYHNTTTDGTNKEVFTEIAVAPKPVLAANFEEAKMVAILEVPEKYKDDLSKLEILVKSF
jgi:hypothetical protein